MPNHFDQVAREWDMNKMHTERTNAIASALLKKGLVRPGMTGLEFGSGTGLLSIALKDHFSEITLIDSSAEMVKITIEKLEEQGIRHLHPEFFDLEHEDYTSRKFDVVFSQMVLHHTDDIQKIFCKFFELLNPKGVLVIADLYAEDGSFHDSAFTGHKGFDPAVLAELLSKHGFTEIDFQPCFTIKKPSETSATKEYPVFLLTAIKQ